MLQQQQQQNKTKYLGFSCVGVKAFAAWAQIVQSHGKLITSHHPGFLSTELLAIYSDDEPRTE